MRVWITSVLIVFGCVELYQWIDQSARDFTVPMPIFVLGGALLAIASNYAKFARQSSQSEASLTDAPNWASLNQSSTTPLPKPARSISFTIRRSDRAEAKNDSL